MIGEKIHSRIAKENITFHEDNGAANKNVLAMEQLKYYGQRISTQERKSAEISSAHTTNLLALTCTTIIATAVTVDAGRVK